MAHSNGFFYLPELLVSSQVYSNARDLARVGIFYLKNGMWDGKRILSKEWVDWIRRPAMRTREIGNTYGGQFWLVPDKRTDLPQDAYSTSGARIVDSGCSRYLENIWLEVLVR